MKLLFTVLMVFFSISSFAQIKENSSVDRSYSSEDAQLYKINDSISYSYTKPKPLSYLKNSWKDMYELPMSVWNKESIKPALFVALSSGLLIAFDDKIYQGVRYLSDEMGLATSNNTYNFSPINNLELNVPTDLASSLYYIGDGLTELSVNAGFYIYGLITKDKRALRVANQLSEGLISIGIYVQVLKHLTMHETPERRTMPEYPRGRWKFFNVTDPGASLKEYSNSVPSNDAFPSGHLATAMMTTTVIALNYPEKRWIKPVCYSLMGICGFQMVNNGVHWAGDYPLAIAMGYSLGKVIVGRGHKVVKNSPDVEESVYKIKPTWRVSPTYFYNGAGGFKLSVSL